LRLEAVEFDPLPDTRWLDAGHSGETREVGGVECEEGQMFVSWWVTRTSSPAATQRRISGHCCGNCWTVAVFMQQTCRAMPLGASWHLRYRTAAAPGEGIESVQTMHATHAATGTGSSSDTSATKYSKPDTRPIISHVARAMLAKYGSLVSGGSGSVRLVRA
jgi:hypothetical protein